MEALLQGHRCTGIRGRCDRWWWSTGWGQGTASSSALGNWPQRRNFARLRKQGRFTARQIHWSNYRRFGIEQERCRTRKTHLEIAINVCKDRRRSSGGVRLAGKWTQERDEGQGEGGQKVESTSPLPSTPPPPSTPPLYNSSLPPSAPFVVHVFQVQWMQNMLYDKILFLFFLYKIYILCSPFHYRVACLPC